MSFAEFLELSDDVALDEAEAAQADALRAAELLFGGRARLAADVAGAFAEFVGDAEQSAAGFEELLGGVVRGVGVFGLDGEVAAEDGQQVFLAEVAVEEIELEALGRVVEVVELPGPVGQLSRDLRVEEVFYFLLLLSEAAQQIASLLSQLLNRGSVHLVRELELLV